MVVIKVLSPLCNPSVSFFLDTFPLWLHGATCLFICVQKRRTMSSQVSYCMNEETSQMHTLPSPRFQSRLLFMTYWLGLGYVFISKLITDKRHGIGMIAIGQGSYVYCITDPFGTHGPLPEFFKCVIK